MIFDKIKEIIIEQFGVNPEDVDLNSNFKDDFGADSLDFLELILALEEGWGIEISEDDAEKIKTVEDAVKYIEGKSE